MGSGVLHAEWGTSNALECIGWLRGHKPVFKFLSACSYVLHHDKDSQLQFSAHLPYVRKLKG